MDADAFEHYLSDRSRAATRLVGSVTAAAGGPPCGDVVRLAASINDGRLVQVGWQAAGCGSTHAAAAAVCELVDGQPVIDAAGVGTATVADELGGLSAGKVHAAELAAEALHRLLAAACRTPEPLAAEPGGDRTLVAMSGGVDSAVAALIERERGAQVVAVTMELWSDPVNDGGRSCCSPEAVQQARSLAHRLGIAHLTLDLRDAFAAEVVEPFVAGYAAGTTPNPCVRCNGDLRLDALLALADRIGAGAVATGHYARLHDDGAGPLLCAPTDRAKDQTHMLSRTDPATLARLRFPLADLEKAAVRSRARSAGLEVADKPESQDLCFLAGEGTHGFLGRHGAKAGPGAIIDADGQQVGRHTGHERYTVGQRRGLGVAATEPLYVTAKDADTNTLTIGPAAALDRDHIELADVRVWRDISRIDGVRVRSHGAVVGCTAGRPSDGGRSLSLRLDDPVRALAPGQTASLLAGELVVGCGVIRLAPRQARRPATVA